MNKATLTIWLLAFLMLGRPVMAAELLVNGSFETGNFTGWTVVNAPNPWYLQSVVGSGFNNGFSQSTTPQHGSFVYYNGLASDPGSFTLVQQITIPTASTASFTWRHKYQLDHLTFCTSCGTATYAVEILNTSNVVLETLYLLTTGSGVMRNTGWQSFARSLNAYAGQTIRIRYRTTMTVSFSGPGQLEVDQVSVQSPSVLVPTAANVPVGGRVLTPKGSGIQNATVTLTDQNGESRIARTNPFGYFHFDDVEAGQTYFVNVRAKGWTFETMTLNVADEITGLEIFAIDE